MNGQKTTNGKVINLMKTTFLIVSLFLFSICSSQNEIVKRKAYQLEIAVNETQQYAMDVRETPYFIKEKVLQIYCNENVFVECEIKGDSISKMKVVKKNINPTKTIVIKFTQNSENRKEISTNLHITNPFDKKLFYDAGMYTPMSKEWQSTSTIPIQPNLQNFEMWPHAIITLVLDNWRFE